MSIPIFSAESPLMKFLGGFADLMILNLVFLATCLPVITIPAGLVALDHTASRLAAGETGGVAGDYLATFRREFRQATLLGLAVFGLLAVLAAWGYVLWFVNLPELVVIVGWVVLFVAGFTLVTTVLYVFPYQARFENSVREVLNNSRLMSIRHLPTTLVVLSLTGLPWVITVYYPALSGYGLFWLLFGFAGVAWVNAILFNSVFSRYTPGRPSTRTT